MSDVGWYEYGARLYEPSIGKFTGVDLLANKFSHQSATNYAGNNPIVNIDLWGTQELRYDLNIKYLNSLSDEKQMEKYEEMLPIAAPATAVMAAPALLGLAPEAGTVAAELYWTKVGAGALGDALNQGIWILMSNGSIDEYNITQTFTHLIQMPGSDAIRPLISVCFSDEL